MNNTKLAAAVGVGYALGRLRKARWALAVAGMAAGKKLTDPKVLFGELLETPQVQELAAGVSGGLAEAGKKAAVAAVSSRIGDLAD